MTIPATGPISLTDLQTEFGGTVPISLSEYYEGGPSGYVTATNYTPAGQIPEPYVGPSGPSANLVPISLNDFRGVTKVVSFTFNDVVTTDTANYNLHARAIAAGWDGTVALNATVTINSGVTVYGTGSSPAWTTYDPTTIASFANGASISLTNNGTIAGAGGSGGTGAPILGSGTAGTDGGTALDTNGIAISVTNNGTIGGGGGGGGGGGSGYWVTEAQTTDYGGGGGGGGRALGAGGAAGDGGGGGFELGGAASPGTAGTLSAPGTGGRGGEYTQGSGPLYGPSGGTGGDLGQPGQPGASAQGAGGAGGASGAAIMGGSSITWYAYGSRLGPIDTAGTNLVPGGVSDHADVTVSHVASADKPGVAWVVFSPNGAEVGYKSDTPTVVYSSTWYSPLTPNIGQNYWIRGTLQSGDAPLEASSDTLNVWHSLSQPRSWVYSIPNGVRQGVVQVQIATDDAGATIVFDVLYSFYAEGSYTGGTGAGGGGSGGGGGGGGEGGNLIQQ